MLIHAYIDVYVFQICSSFIASVIAVYGSSRRTRLLVIQGVATGCVYICLGIFFAQELEMFRAGIAGLCVNVFCVGVVLLLAPRAVDPETERQLSEQNGYRMFR